MMGILSFDTALWQQRQANAAFESRLAKMRSTVASPHNMSVPQWLYLYAHVLSYQPDLIVELGRGAGNFTSIVTECANMLGATKVVGVGYDGTCTWENITVPNLAKLDGIDDGWFEPLTVIHADILETDFGEIVGHLKKTIIFWDAHGFRLAYYILGHFLPLIEGTSHAVLIHDISDSRHVVSLRTYTRSDGEPTYWANRFSCPFEELIALYDFISRNGIQPHSVDNDIRDRLQSDEEVWGVLRDEFDEAFPSDGPLGPGHMVYFSLDDRCSQDVEISYPGELPPNHFVNRLTL